MGQSSFLFPSDRYKDLSGDCKPTDVTFVMKVLFKAYRIEEIKLYITCFQAENDSERS